MLPALSLVHEDLSQPFQLVYFFIETYDGVRYAVTKRNNHAWWTRFVDFEPERVLMSSTCQTCAKDYDPKETSSPRRYCSQECYQFGAKAYNKNSVKPDKVESFAVKLVDHIHWLSHNNDERFDCEWDLCVEAKILGL